MRKLTRLASAAVAGAALVLVLGGGALAEKGRGGSDDSHGSHGSSGHGSDDGHESHRSSGHGAAAPQGALLRESKVDGFTLTYRVYSWEERNQMMKGMEGHEMHGMDASGRSTHHLMLFAKGPDGREVAGGKVGFVVVAPDKSEFKTLTMGMAGGYGADVPLKAPGVHTLRTKAVFGDRTVQEEFSYAVK